MKKLSILIVISLTVLFSNCNSKPEIKSESNKSSNNEVIENKSDFESLIATANNYYNIKNGEMALEYYLKAYEIDSTNILLLINVGNVYFDIQQFSNAIHFYAKALEIDKSNQNVRCDMATCIGYSGNLEEAIKVLDENIQINNSHAQSHYNKAVFLEKLGKKVEAEKEIAIYNTLKR